ncbi:MAG: hypothetical protein QOJ75_2256 [Chloroflexota bacterium]|nr:hypothetical protein [Chloroflexota bacterium]
MELDDADGAPDTRADSRRSPSLSRPEAAPARVGVLDALRISVHPPKFREDLASLPWLALHTRALWIPVLVVVASTIAVIATGGKDVVTAFLFAYFVQTPAIGGVFLAGFLAPRASWLLGLIVGLVAAIGYAAYVIVAASRLSGADAPDPGLVRDTIISALVLSPILGALFAAAAAWYRRFLRLSNPNRGRQAAAQRRGGDGRSRGSNGSQKAGARR